MFLSSVFVALLCVSCGRGTPMTVAGNDLGNDLGAGAVTTGLDDGADGDAKDGSSLTPVFSGGGQDTSGAGAVGGVALVVPVVINAKQVPLSRVVASRSASKNGTRVDDTFTTAIPVVVDVSGHVTGRYYSTTLQSNAGVMGTIAIDGVVCSAHFDFEAVSSSITFQSSPSCLKVLPAGTHTISVYDAVAGAYPNMSAYRAQVQYRALPAPGRSDSPVLGANTLQDNTASVSTTFTNTVPIVLNLSGYVRGTYNAATQQNAGVKATLALDGTDCASDLSFEALSKSITFHSSVSCMLVVAPGTHTISVRDSGGHANITGYFSRLMFEALPAAPVRASAPVVVATTASENDSSVSTTFTNSIPVLLRVSGYVTGNYYSTTTQSNAGVIAAISIDGAAPCAKTMSFEALSSSITFHASASCLVTLAPGSHTIRVHDAFGHAGMRDFQSKLFAEALAAP